MRYLQVAPLRRFFQAISRIRTSVLGRALPCNIIRIVLYFHRNVGGIRRYSAIYRTSLDRDDDSFSTNAEPSEANTEIESDFEVLSEERFATTLSRWYPQSISFPMLSRTFKFRFFQDFPLEFRAELAELSVHLTGSHSSTPSNDARCAGGPFLAHGTGTSAFLRVQ